MQNTAVEIQGLSKAFGANKVLRGIDLELYHGQVTALMGVNGARKSTLVGVLCGVHAANGGVARLYGKAFPPSSPAEAIKAPELADAIGLDVDVRREVSELGLADRQSVAIARAMAHKPKLLILDGPFHGVDNQPRRDIGAKIRETAKGRATVVMVAEMDEAVEIADRIVVMAEHTIKGVHRNENMDLNMVLAQVASVEKGR